MASQKGAMSTQKVEGAGLTIQSRKKGKGFSTGKGKASTNADESNTSASPQKTSSVAENFVVRIRMVDDRMINIFRRPHP